MICPNLPMFTIVAVRKPYRMLWWFNPTYAEEIK